MYQQPPHMPLQHTYYRPPPPPPPQPAPPVQAPPSSMPELNMDPAQRVSLIHILYLVFDSTYMGLTPILFFSYSKC